MLHTAITLDCWALPAPAPSSSPAAHGCQGGSHVLLLRTSMRRRSFGVKDSSRASTGTRLLCTGSLSVSKPLHKHSNLSAAPAEGRRTDTGHSALYAQGAVKEPIPLVLDEQQYSVQATSTGSKVAIHVQLLGLHLTMTSLT
jgi:hypothetical protein